MSVLIAEDDPTSRFLLKEVLTTRLKMEVVMAEDGAKAWELLSNGLRPDLLISDIMMPEMNGFQLLEKVRSHPELRGLKVIFCSSLTEREIVPIGAKLGLHCYILKPYRPELIEEKVMQAMRDRPVKGIASRSAICSRLHINERALERLHLQLYEEVKRTAAELRNMIAAGEIGAAAVKVARFRSSTGNLGAIGLEGQFQKLEKTIYKTRQLPPEWVRLGKTNLPEQSECKQQLEELLDLLDDLEAENERFEDAIVPAVPAAA